MKKSCRASLVILLLSFNLDGCKVKPQDIKSPIVLRVDNASITEAECVERIKAMPSYEALLTYEAGRKKFLDILTQELILVSLAQQKGFDKDPRYLAKVELQKHELLADLYRSYLLEGGEAADATKSFAASHQELRIPEIMISRIVLKSQADAQKAMRLLNGGTPFAQVAQTMSIDKETAQKKGSVGLLSAGDKKMYGKTLEQLADGQRSAVVKTPRGYELLRRDKTLYPTVMIPKDVQEKIRQQNQFISTELSKLKPSMKIQVNDAFFDTLILYTSSSTFTSLKI